MLSWGELKDQNFVTPRQVCFPNVSKMCCKGHLNKKWLWKSQRRISRTLEAGKRQLISKDRRRLSVSTSK